MPISAQENTKEILPEHRLQTGNVVMPDSLNVATMGTAVARDSGKYKSIDNTLNEKTSAQKAIDGLINENNAWFSASDAKGVQYLEVTLDKSYVITGITLFVAKSTNIADMTLQYCANGSWMDINVAENVTERKNVAKYSLGSGITADKLRLNYNGNGSISVEELEIYGYTPTSKTNGKQDMFFDNYTDISDFQLGKIVERLCMVNVMLPDGTAEFRPEESITRGEFVKEVINLFCIQNAVNVNPVSRQFNDVATDHKYAEYIFLAAELGIVSGNGGEFRPDDNVTYNEAVKMLVSAAGYDVYAQAKGGYPYGYFICLDYMDVKLDIAVDRNGFINREQAAVILNEMLDGKTLDDSEINYDYVTVKPSQLTILNKYHHIYTEEGLVEAVGETAITANGGVLPRHIMINGKKYNKGTLDVSGFLGRLVEYQYRQIKGEEDTLLIIEPRDADDVLDIPCENVFDIKDYSGDKYELSYDIGDKSKKVKIPKSAIMIYNGNVVGSYNETHLSLKNGTIRLIDNDDDSAYDIIIVSAFSDMFVRAVNYTDEIIYGYNGVELHLEDFDYDIQGVDGALELKDIVPDTVISYKKTGKDSYSIYVTDEYITGSVDELSDDGSDITVKIGENEYKVSSYYKLAVSSGMAQQLNLRDTGDFYVNSSNEIVWADVTSGYEEYAFLLGVMVENIDHCSFKMVDSQSNRIILESSGNITSNIIPGETKPEAVELVNALKGVQTIVKISRTGLGKLRSINYCENSIDVNNADWSNGQKTFFVGANPKNPFDRSSRKSPWGDNVYLMDDDGVVFSMKKDSSGNIIERTIAATASGGYYNGTLYGVDNSSRIFKAAVVENIVSTNDEDMAESELSYDVESKQSYNSMVFLGFTMQLDEEKNEIKNIKCLYNGKEQRVPLGEYVTEEQCATLSYGDVISASIDNENRITSWAKVIDFDDDWNQPKITAHTSRGNWYQPNGNPSYMENGYMVIGDGIGGIPMSYSTLLTAYVFDLNEKKVTIGTANEISKDDYVLFNMYRFSLKDVLILKDYRK